MGMPVVTPLMIMIAALGIFNFFGMMIMIMMFVPMVMSALLMSVIMCMSVVVIIVLELRYFRFEIIDV